MYWQQNTYYGTFICHTSGKGVEEKEKKKKLALGMKIVCFAIVSL